MGTRTCGREAEAGTEQRVRRTRKNPKTTQRIHAQSRGPAARKMYKVIAKANLYISGRAAMEAWRLSKCEYGTERQQNLLKMPLALRCEVW